MSESLAGVTLLAMGNGAPDVLTSVSAAGSEHTGMFFSVGSLAGSGLFVTGVVTAFVIIFSKKQIELPGLSILRDVVFYMAALITVLIGSIVGELNIYFAVTFFLIYISYVTVVVIMDKYEQKGAKQNPEQRPDQPITKPQSSLNPDFDSLVESTDERSDEDDKFFYDKAVSQNVKDMQERFIEKNEDNRKALTQDSSKEEDKSGDEWSMVYEDTENPNHPEESQRFQEPQGSQIGTNMR